MLYAKFILPLLAVDSETKKASIFNDYAICVSFVPVENGTQITKLTATTS